MRVPEIAGVRTQRLAIPFGGQIRTIRRAAVAQQELAGDGVMIVLPLNIGTENAIVRAAADLAIGGQKAGIRSSEIVSDASDQHLR